MVLYTNDSQTQRFFMLKRLLIVLLGIFSNTVFAAEQVPIPSTQSDEVLELVQSSVNHLNVDFLSKLIRLFQVEVFVETSTYLGETSSECARLFKEVYTIEDNHKLFLKAKKKFRNIPNVYCYEGDSEITLKKLLPKIHGKILFWLDSHHKYGQEQKGLASIALRKELEAIKQTGVKNSVILINEIQLFPGSASSSNELNLKEIQSLLKEINSSYQLWVLGDIAIALPELDPSSLSPLVKACTSSLLFAQEENVKDVLQAEKILMSGFTEKDFPILSALHDVYTSNKKHFASMEDPSVHYILWKGLSLMGQKEYFEASRCFHSAIAKGYNHWRVYWYMAQSEYERRNLEEAQKALLKVMHDAPDFAEASELAVKIKNKSL